MFATLPLFCDEAFSLGGVDSPLQFLSRWPGSQNLTKRAQVVQQKQEALQGLYQVSFF